MLDTQFTLYATELPPRKRKTILTVGDVDFGRLRIPSDKRRVIEEIDHILIWARYDHQTAGSLPSSPLVVVARAG